MNRPEQALNELPGGIRASRDSDEGIGAIVRQPDAPRPDPIGSSINRSYFVLRRWIAILAIALPVVLWIGGGWVPNPSISSYYHVPGGWLRDALVGTLSAIGFFLYFYRGYSTVEDLVLNLVGVSAVLVAFVPMPCTDPDWACTSGPAGAPFLFPAGLRNLHYVAATTMFLAMAYVCIWESRRTLEKLNDPGEQQAYQRTYNVLGTLMWFVPASIWAIHLLSKRMPQAQAIEESWTVFAIETAGIWIFAVFWLVKSREIARIQAQA